MSHLHKRIELVANIAIILVAILLVVVLTKRFVFTPRNQNQPTNNIPSNVGARLSQVDIDWSKSNKNVLLLLSTSCHFCTESAPFYKRLVQERTQRGTFSLTAVLPQPVSEGQAYLKGLGVDINDIKQLSPAAIRIRGTPTILLVDGSGVVTEEWLGKLPSEKQDEVLSRLQ